MSTYTCRSCGVEETCQAPDRCEVCASGQCLECFNRDNPVPHDDDE